MKQQKHRELLKILLPIEWLVWWEGILAVQTQSPFGDTPQMGSTSPTALIPYPKTTKQNSSPKHVPSKIIAVKGIPYTISGKKVELAVKKIVEGKKVDNRDSLQNPLTLEYFKNIQELSI